jgi:dipeptidyl aminopeptidase/acylaminoacyl peptidase
LRRSSSAFCAAAALAVLIVAAVLPAAAQPPAPPHPFSVHDMLAMNRLSDLQVSPDGVWVVFTIRVTDLEANRGRTDLWLARSDGSGLRQLTTDPENDSNPRWGSDGAIYFLSSRSGSSQVWMIDPKGGEASQITKLPLDVDALEIAPAAGAMVFAMRVYPGSTVEQTVARDKEQGERKGSGRTYDELLYRHWDTWWDHKRSHLFVRPLQGTDAQARDLMPALDADVPTLPFGGPEEFAVSPDGTTLVFTARASAPRDLTTPNRAVDMNPVFSKDGRTLAYLAMARPGFEADRTRIMLMEWPSGATRALTEAWDRSAANVAWDEKGATIFCTAENLGQNSIFAVDVKTGQPREVVHDGTNEAPLPVKDGLVFLQNSLKSPNELWTVHRDGKNLRRLTHVNDAQVAAAKMGEPEQFTFKGWNDETVYGYLVKPYDFDPAKKYPVAFLIHGGPQGSFGNDFHYRWNPQAYVGAGFATVMIDFHGSTGYGQAFTDAISGHWQDRPFEDLMKGLDAALARYPFLDGDRCVAAGASYGAYMINWLLGHTSRFKAMVSHDGNIDERFAYFDTDELWFPEWEHGGTPWENPQGYEVCNPVEYVKNWRTPTLVVHGERDYRIPYAEGLGTFTALRRQGVPARLLIFPDENHFVLKPQNSIEWHDEVMAWLTKWIR